ncbi:MAG: hypothetical protein AABO58_24500 [Acidobacteriota bacterium]
MKNTVFLFVLLFTTVAVAQQTATIAPQPPIIPNYAYQYAAKIVCGRPAPTPTYAFQVGAHGTYFTQVNVHNPSRTQGVSIRKKFINAQPDERPTKPTQFFGLGLEPDWATQIDCHNILKHLGLPPGAYVEGFVILESTLEIDVVGLYTADGPSGLISTMEIDRVPARKF